VYRAANVEKIARWRSENRHYFRSERREKRRQFHEFVDRLKAVACADCGRCFPTCAMDFDHRDGELKKFEISDRIDVDNELLAEIGKCDVVCACCHRVRTKLRHHLRIEEEIAQAADPPPKAGKHAV